MYPRMTLLCLALASIAAAMAGCHPTSNSSATDAREDDVAAAKRERGLVRIASAPDCSAQAGSCSYQADFLRLGVSTPITISFETAAVGSLQLGDLVAAFVDKAPTPGSAVRSAKLILKGSLVRIAAEGDCGEFDPHVVGDACKYQASVVAGSAAGASIELFVRDREKGDLKTGDLVDVALNQLRVPEYPTEFLATLRTDKSLVRITTSDVCGEQDPIVVGDACAYTGRVLSGAAQGRSIPFFLASDTGISFLKAGDLVPLSLAKISDNIDPMNQEAYMNYPDEYLAKHD
jgi:hypothetical protein